MRTCAKQHHLLSVYLKRWSLKPKELQQDSLGARGSQTADGKIGGERVDMGGEGGHCGGGREVDMAGTGSDRVRLQPEIKVTPATKPFPGEPQPNSQL